MDEEFLENEAPVVMQVPEHIVKLSADALSKIDANNMFAQLINASNVFKEAGMTPIFLYDCGKMHLSLVAMETFGRRLH